MSSVDSKLVTGSVSLVGDPSSHGGKCVNPAPGASVPWLNWLTGSRLGVGPSSSSVLEWASASSASELSVASEVTTVSVIASVVFGISFELSSTEDGEVAAGVSFTASTGGDVSEMDSVVASLSGVCFMVCCVAGSSSAGAWVEVKSSAGAFGSSDGGIGTNVVMGSLSVVTPSSCNSWGPLSLGGFSVLSPWIAAWVVLDSVSNDSVESGTECGEVAFFPSSSSPIFSWTLATVVSCSFGV